MARFTLPRDIYYGDNAIDELKNLKGHKRAIIVTGGSSMKKGGFLQQAGSGRRQIVLRTILAGLRPAYGGFAAGLRPPGPAPTTNYSQREEITPCSIEANSRNTKWTWKTALSPRK